MMHLKINFMMNKEILLGKGKIQTRAVERVEVKQKKVNTLKRKKALRMNKYGILKEVFLMKTQQMSILEQGLLLT